MIRLWPILCAVLLALFCAVANPVAAQTHDQTLTYDDGLRAYDRRDFATAMRHWERASDGGHGMAAYRLGLMYGRGIGVAPDFARASELMDLATARRVTDAEVKFLQYFQLAYGPSGAAAFRLTKAVRRAEAGNPVAQHYVATLFAKGMGTERNFPEAIRWYQRAAAQGHALSQRALISINLINRGPGHGHVEAFKWYIIYRAHHKDAPDKDVEFLIKHVTAKMAPAKTRKANQLAQSWLAEHPNR